MKLTEMKRMGMVTTTLALIIVTASTCYAGVGSSGGGIGVYCPGAPLQILDLYEAKTIHGLNLVPSSGNLDVDLLKARKFLEYFSTDPLPSDQEILAEIKKWMDEKIDWVAPGSLELTQDATLPSIPADCKFVQVAVYQDDADRVQIDRVLWQQLNTLHQSALLLHENIYKLARSMRARTSDDTRRMIGLFYSNQSIAPYWPEISDAKALVCTSGFSDEGLNQFINFFTIVNTFENGIAGVRIYFSALDGYFMLSKTTAFIPGESIEDFLRNGTSGNGLGNRIISANQEWINRNWIVEFQKNLLDVENPSPDYFSYKVRSHASGLSTSSEFSTGYCMMGQIGSL